MNTQSIVTMAKENVSNVSLHVPGVHPSVAFTVEHGKYVSASTLAQAPYTQSLPEMSREKTCFLGFQPGPTQTGLNNYKRWLEA